MDDEHNEETQVAQRAITAGKGGAGRGGGQQSGHVPVQWQARGVQDAPLQHMQMCCIQVLVTHAAQTLPTAPM